MTYESKKDNRPKTEGSESKKQKTAADQQSQNDRQNDDYDDDLDGDEDLDDEERRSFSAGPDDDFPFI